MIGYTASITGLTNTRLEITLWFLHEKNLAQLAKCPLIESGLGLFVTIPIVIVGH